MYKKMETFQATRIQASVTKSSCRLLVFLFYHIQCPRHSFRPVSNWNFHLRYRSSCNAQRQKIGEAKSFCVKCNQQKPAGMLAKTKKAEKTQERKTKTKLGYSKKK